MRHIERLDRRLLLASVAALNGRELVITGDASANDIAIEFASGMYRVTHDGQTSEFDATDVDAVRVDTLAGNDRVSIGVLLPSTLLGGEGDDTLVGGSLIDSIEGGSGSDLLEGSMGHDRLIDDPPAGAGGNDTLLGGDGNDDLVSRGGADVLAGGAGQDLADFSSFSVDLQLSLDGVANDGPTSSPTSNLMSLERITGGSLNDLIIGSSHDNTLIGGAGDDTIQGLGDADVIFAGPGNDSVWGGSGHDSLYGEAGADHMNGHAGSDMLNGGDGDDTLYGASGSDSLSPGYGNNLLFGNAGNDTLGAPGAYNTSSFNTINTYDGGTGNDSFWVGRKGETTQAIGRSGEDRFILIDTNTALANTRPANTTLLGGGGRDLLDVLTYKAPTGVQITLNNLPDDDLYGGSDFVNEVESFWLSKVDDLFDASAVSFRVEVFGGFGDDTLIGGSGHDKLEGANGNDSLVGNAGNDLLSGHAHRDTLVGGAGTDTLNGGYGDDSILANDNEHDDITGGLGIDTAQHDASLDLVENCE